MYKKIDNLIYFIVGLYFLSSIFLLLLFWFKFYISIPIIGIMIYIFYKFYSNKSYLKEEEYKNLFNLKKWVILIVLVVIFSFLSGAGGYFYQNWDYNARNAVLNDLIEYKWPVVYNYNLVDSKIMGFNKGILSYYFTYWLPAAGIGKIFGYQCANVFMLFYQILGLLLFFYFLARYFRKINIRYFFIFFSFSGADIIGRFIFSCINGNPIDVMSFIGTMHIDTFGEYFCFSSFVTQVFWVFNQAIPAFIITLLMLNEKNYSNIGIFMLLLLPFAPFPAVGLLYLIIIFTLFGFECREKFNLFRVKELFSIQNLLCFVSVLPIILLFFMNAGGHNSGLIFFREGIQGNILNIMVKYLILMILEVYIYILLVSNKTNCKLLLLVGLFLSIIPFYYIGIGLDFCNRVSIPLLIIVLLYVIKYLNMKESFSNKNLVKSICLIIFLIISSITGMNEIRRSIYMTKDNYSNGVSNITDNWKTYGKINNATDAKFFSNFVSKKKNNIYFRYIVK